ncbi:MAG: serine hydrolase [Ignavibacteria bacterium]
MKICLSIKTLLLFLLFIFHGSIKSDIQKSIDFQQFFELSTDLDSLIKPIISNFPYPIGVAFLDLNSNEKYLFNEREIFPTASAIKIEILIHLMKEYERRNLNLYENIQVKERTGGSGLLQYFDQSDLRLSYYNLALLMIQQSDNAATNILINKLGMENINKTIQQLGLKNTKLQRKMMDFEARKLGKENISSPEDKLKLLEIIYKQQFLSDSLNNEVLKILSIPKSTPLLNDIYEEITLASKGGELDDVRCEMGIFFCKDFNYILVVMTKDLPHSKIGEDMIGKISKTIFNYMRRKYSK